MVAQRTGSQFERDLCMVAHSEYDADGWLSVTADGYGEQSSGVPHGEVHSPYGFLSRPLDPDTDDSANVKLGCNVWWSWEGNEPHAELGSDPRVTPKLPQLQKGESVLYGPASNFFRCHADGSAVRFTTADGTPTGQTIYDRMSPTGFLKFAPWGKETFDANGYHLFTASGARLDLGGIGGLPAPLSALGAYARLSAPVVQLMGTLIALGPSTGVAEPAAKATSVQAYMTALETGLTAAAAAATAIPSGGQALGTALTSLVASLAGLKLLIGAQSVTVV